MRFALAIPTCFALSVLMLLAVRGGAQAVAGLPPQDALFQTIAMQDKALFDAYNTCDLKALSALVTDDLEFYHDKTGLAVGRATFLDSIQKNICGKVVRELTPGSLEVHPLASFGAVEIGAHRFHHPGEQDHGVVGEAKFVMIWKKTDAGWKLSRVISYDHGVVQ
jgi:ketosteroid isomerase-like protein